MRIVSWNIQAAKGIDGVIDVARIANVTRDFGDADVICFQEVEQTIGSQVQRASQAESLAGFFPEHEMFYGPAIDRLIEGGRARFGNMILSRLPVHNVLLHKLPQPADPETRNMARQATEILVDFNNRPLRIMTTHLEYFASGQRAAQIEYFMRYLQESRERAENPSPSGEGSYSAPPETLLTVLCGDFNLTPDSPDYTALLESTRGNALVDAWTLVHGDQSHAPTCGIFDHHQWPDGQHCRDFFFVTPELGKLVGDTVVNTETTASDHQPILLVLE